MNSNTDSLLDMVGTLYGDCKHAQDNLNENDTPYNRRAFVRAAFASIEATTFHLKQQALGKQRDGIFSQAEFALLMEETYTLDKGKAVSQVKFLPLDQNFLFAIAMFSRAAKSPFMLEKGKEWETFKQAIQVRNRITHPKRPELLDISDGELDDVALAHRWVIMSIVHSISAGVTAMRAEIEEKLRERGIDISEAAPS